MCVCVCVCVCGDRKREEKREISAQEHFKDKISFSICSLCKESNIILIVLNILEITSCGYLKEL